MLRLFLGTVSCINALSNELDFCPEPIDWYKQSGTNVKFACPTELRDHSECQIKCPKDWTPTFEKVSCSCTRKAGEPRDRCTWYPKRLYYKPDCIPPVMTAGTSTRSQRTKKPPVKVPFVAEFEKIVYSPAQAVILGKLAKSSGTEMTSKNVLRFQENHEENKAANKAQKHNPNLRSHEKVVAKWTQIKDDQGRYEVPYKFGDTFSYDNSVKNSLKSHLSWMNSELDQCLQFTERNEKYFYHDRLNIISTDDGCWSYIGRIYRDQFISLGYGCHGQGRALHEFIHALGFIHEHQREDRNEHIKINWENIKEKHKVDFHKTPLGEYQDNLLGYDVNSIMHYGAKAFAKNEGQNTIKFLDDKVFTGQRLRPTTKDMQGICTAYGCDKSCGKEVKTCDNKKEEYFASRACDGFKDCSDGTDEKSCVAECCDSFNFYIYRFTLAGDFEGFPYYSEPGGTNLYYHQGMGYWLMATELGSEYAYAFANYVPGLCLNEVTTWQMYDFVIASWVTYNNEQNCAATGPGPGPAWQIFTESGCEKSALPNLAHGGSYTCSNDAETSDEGHTCLAVCPSDSKMVCKNSKSTTATCTHTNDEWKWLSGGEEFDCNCEKVFCSSDHLALKPGNFGYSWDCDNKEGKLVPANAECRPKCNDPGRTAMTDFASASCSAEGFFHFHFLNRIKTKSNAVMTKKDLKTMVKINCKACKPPKFLPSKDGQYTCSETPSDSLSWFPGNGKSMKLGTTCKAVCPANKSMDCVGRGIRGKPHLKGKQECIRKTDPGKNDNLVWSVGQKCSCITQCSLEPYAEFRDTSNIKLRGRYSKVIGVNTKLSAKKCPGQKTVLTCNAKGNWVSFKDRNVVNPPLCQ